MDPTSSSSSRSGSSSSTWPDDASHSVATPGSIPDTSSSIADRSSAPHGKRLIPARSRLAKPFRSPLKRNPSQQSMEPNAPAISSTKTSSERGRAEDTASSPASTRKQRQALETRLLTLQQANQCLKDNALITLPQDIARWREAGQLAAQDLWKMTGADDGDWSGLSSIPSRGDYGLESPPSTLADTSEPQKRKAAESPEPSNPPLLLRRHRVDSPGAEEQAAALLSIDSPLHRQKGEDSQGARSEASLPELSELLRRSQSVVGASSTSRQRERLIATQDDGRPTVSESASGGRGIERKWNIGSMLDMLGADKSTLAWDVEEEEFRDPTTGASEARSA